MLQQAVQQALAIGIENIDGIDPQMAITLDAEIREDACRSVTGIVGNFENAANYHGKIWRQKLQSYYPSFTVENLVEEITAAAEYGSNYTLEVTVEDMNQTSGMWQLSSNVTADNTTLAELATIRNNITLVTNS